MNILRVFRNAWCRLGGRCPVHGEPRVRESCKEFIIRGMSENGGTIHRPCVQHLGKAAGFSQRTLDRCVSEMVRDGMIARGKDRRNGRIAVYTLSPNP